MTVCLRAKLQRERVILKAGVGDRCQGLPLPADRLDVAAEFKYVRRLTV